MCLPVCVLFIIFWACFVFVFCMFGVSFFLSGFISPACGILSLMNGFGGFFCLGI
jgi:hypothetical protein